MKMKIQVTTTLVLFLISFLNVCVADRKTLGSTTTLTPRESLIQYWNTKIRNDISIAPFLLSKASPLDAAESASFSKLASSNSLGTRLVEFCSSAKLFCYPDLENDSADGYKINGNKHYNAINGNEHYHAINGNEHYHTINGNKNYDAINGNKHYHAINGNEHYHAINGNKHYDAINGNEHYHAINGNEHYHAINGNKHYNASASAHEVVEPGMFFREEMLKKGTVMPMPDVTDNTPEMSFLPRTITSELPFSSSKIWDIKGIFGAGHGSTMEKIIKDALEVCERAPSAGDTKRCVGSAEDMIDFATSVLGRDVTVRTMENGNGSKGKIMVGEVKVLSGGMETNTVSCHKILYPYLLYYCHSQAKARVYEADMLDPTSKARINHAVAVCHLDTSSWSPDHVAFQSVGSSPGQTEVCHWIFQTELSWDIV